MQPVAHRSSLARSYPFPEATLSFYGGKMWDMRMDPGQLGLQSGSLPSMCTMVLPKSASGAHALPCLGSPLSSMLSHTPQPP